MHRLCWKQGESKRGKTWSHQPQALALKTSGFSSIHRDDVRLRLAAARASAAQPRLSAPRGRTKFRVGQQPSNLLLLATLTAADFIPGWEAGTVK